MRYQQLVGERNGVPEVAEAYHRLSPAARTAALTLLFSRASLPASELAGLGAEQANGRVAALVGGKNEALAALWQVRRAGLAALMRERRYDLYVLPDESREQLWPLGARELRSRHPPITFVVQAGLRPEQIGQAGTDAASAFLYDLAALIAFVRSEEALLGPGGVLQRRAQLALNECLAVREAVPQERGSGPACPPRVGFLVEIARRAGLVQAGPGDGERLLEGPLASAWLKAPPGRRLARVLAAWSAQLAGTEVDALLVMDAVRWLQAPGRGLWVKGFAEAVSHFEDEPFPAYRLASLIRALQRLAWMGAVFMWRVRWRETPPESDQAASVSVKTAPSQRHGLPPLADVAVALTPVGEVLWNGLSEPPALYEAAGLEEEPADEEGELPQLELAAAPQEGSPAPSQRCARGSSPNGHRVRPAACGDEGLTEPDLAQTLERVLPSEEPHAFIQPNFEILAPRHMQAEKLCRLLELCSVVKADRMVQLRLEPQRVAACVREGRWSPYEVMQLLASCSRHELPQNVRYTIAEALRPLGRVQLMDGILVRADDPEVAEALARAAAGAGVELERLSGEAFFMDRRHIAALVAAAEAAGYPVRAWVRGTRVPYPVEQAAQVGAAVEAAALQAARESGRVVERRPPPMLVRGHRDLVFVAPEGEPDLQVVLGPKRPDPAWRRREGGLLSGSHAVRGEDLGVPS